MSLLDPGYFEKNNSKQEYRQAQEQILCVRKQFINNAIKENYLFYPSTTRFLPSFFGSSGFSVGSPCQELAG